MKKNILYFLFFCSATYASVNAADRYKQAGIAGRFKWWSQEQASGATRHARHAVTSTTRRSFGPPPPDILFEHAFYEEPSQSLYATAPTPPPSSRAIFEAAANGDIKAIEKYIAIGANIDNPDYGDGLDCYTPLLKAAKAGHNNVVIALLNAGADVNFVSHNSNPPEDGNTALVLASYEGHLSVVQTLLARRANVDHKTRSGYSALMLATNNWTICLDKARKDTFDNIIQALYLAGASMGTSESEDEDFEDTPPLTGESEVFEGATATAGEMPPLEPVNNDDGEDNDELA